MRRRLPYTMVEIMVVILIIAMIFAIIVPRIKDSPRRMKVESSLTVIRQAFIDAAARARAQGKAYNITFVFDATEGTEINVNLSSADENLERIWNPRVELKANENESILSEINQYELPPTLVWENLADYEETELVYTFYPDGQAGGPDLVFTLANQVFELTVDNITGRPIIFNR